MNDGAAGGEHGVKEEGAHFFGARRKFAVVFDGLKSFFVAIDADVPDAGGGD